MSSFPGELFILGDFNLHLDSPSNHTNTFTDLLTYFSLRQHVDFPTHFHGHWLDLFITRTACDLMKTVYPSDGLSDHMTVIAVVMLVSNLYLVQSKSVFHTDVLKAYLLQILFQTLNFLL